MAKVPVSFEWLSGCSGCELGIVDLHEKLLKVLEAVEIVRLPILVDVKENKGKVMKQLTQQLKNGRMEILEAPFPVLKPGYVLVRNHYSVISTGTERKTVRDARKGYLAKARAREKERQAPAGEWTP